VPAGLLGYAREMQLENEWKDVKDIAERALKMALSPERTSVQGEKPAVWKTSRTQPAGVWAADDDRVTHGLFPNE
jgi:hypothetical protein